MSSADDDNELSTKTLLSVLRDHYELHPDRVFLTWLDKKGREVSTLSYRELWVQSGLVARLLLVGKGLVPGDRVMICYPFGLDFLVGIFGCMRAGLVPCSVYPPAPNRLAADLPVFMKKVEDAGAQHALTTTSFRRALYAASLFSKGFGKLQWIVTDRLTSSTNTPMTPVPTILVTPTKKSPTQSTLFFRNFRQEEEEEEEGTALTNNDNGPSPDDIAFVQYTSGSTGFPKGVMISHRSLLGNCREMVRCTGPLHLSVGRVMVSWTPQYHDLGLIGTFMSAVYGGLNAYAFSPLDFIRDPLLWHNSIVHYQAKCTTGPNFAYGLVARRLLKKQQQQQQQQSSYPKQPPNDESQRWTSIDAACNGAEPVDPKVLDAMYNVLGIRKGCVQIGYGMAETGLFIATGSANVLPNTQLVACGHTDQLSTIRVVRVPTPLQQDDDDDDQNPPPQEIKQENKVGEIWVQSPLLAKGYWGQEQLTQDTFGNTLEGYDGHWLRTGDLGKIVNGELYVTGRIKEVIIINGKNYYPVDIERTLEDAFPESVRPGCNVAFQYSSSAIGMVIEMRKGVTKEEQPNPQRIRQIVSELHGVSAVYICLLKDHTVPKTTSGKLQRTRAKQYSLDNKWKPETVLDKLEIVVTNDDDAAAPEFYDASSLPDDSDDDLVHDDDDDDDAGVMVVLDRQGSRKGLLSTDPQLLSPPQPEEISIIYSPESLMTVVVVGAGPAGLTCAVALAQRSVQVTVIDVLPAGLRHGPPFAYHLQQQSPNSVKQWKDLGVNITQVPQSNPVRFTADGYLLDPPDEDDVNRFIEEMTELLDTRNFDVGQTVGQYLDTCGYDGKFIWQYFIGGVVSLFGGGSTQEYLDTPLHLMAWLFMSSVRNANKPLLCIDHEEYLSALRTTLDQLGVEIHTDAESRLLSRDDYKIKIEVGKTSQTADKLVLALPPDDAAKFLGPHATMDELMLRAFGVREESVVLHRDTKYVRSREGDVIHIRLPYKRGYWPNRTDTPAFTYVDMRKDANAECPFATLSFNNAKTLKFYEFYGTTETISWKNVRRSDYTYRLQYHVQRNQGQLATYFVGGWTKGLMLHEDAILSGFEVANMVLMTVGAQPADILERMIPAPKHPQLDTSIRSHGNRSSRRTKTIEIVKASAEMLSTDTVRSSLRSSLGRDVALDETMSHLGLSSMEVSRLHSVMLDKLKLDAEDFPVDWLFEGDLTINELVSRIHTNQRTGSSRSQSVSENLEAAAYEAVLESTLQILEDIAEETVPAEKSLESLRLTPTELKEFYTELCEAFVLQSEQFPYSWLLENKGAPIEEIASRIYALNEESTRGKPQYISPAIHAQPPLTIISFPLINQLLAMLVPAIFLGLATFPTWVLFMYVANGDYLSIILFAMSPVFAFVYGVTAATLLVAFKWILVGKQRAGHCAVWSVPFAKRWAVRQCCRLAWTFTPLGWLNGTEYLCKIYRMLGCKIGMNVSLSAGAFDDFDLVTIGSHSSVDGMLNTELVSLGVQTLAPIHVGRGCSIATGSVIEHGCTLGDNVSVREVTMIPRDSVLEDNTHWHGSPAAEHFPSASDIEGGGVQAPTVHDILKRLPFEINGLVTIMVVSPYLFTIELGVSFLVAYVLWQELGWLGMGALIWMAPTAGMLVAVGVTIFAKWGLLGRVTPGSWPLYGTFHCSKWFVDHLIDEHMLLWIQFAMFAGSPVAMSAFFQVTCLRLFGAQIDRITRFPPSALKNYDLLEMKDGALVGGGAFLFCFETVEGRIVGRKIKLGKDCFIGTKSVLLPGVSVAERASVAAYSLISDDLEADQICVGTKVHRSISASSVSDDEESAFDHDNDDSNSEGTPIHWLQRIEEEASLYCSLVVWLGASVATLSLTYFIQEGPRLSLDPDNESSLALACSVILAGGICIVAPLYSFVMLVVTKLLLVVQFMPEEVGHGRGRRMALCKAWDFAMDFAYRFFVVQAYAGTFMEVTLQKALGADLGSRVYLDGNWIFEPDLVTIGDDTSINNFASLVPHQYSNQGIEYGRVRIGNRCTVGSMTTIHGRAIAEDNMEISALSMPLIGTHLTSGGRWIGYPATKTPGLLYQPPRPPLPAWLVMIQHPFSLLFGTIWVLLLSFDKLLCCVRGESSSYSRVTAPGRKEVPRELHGQFTLDNTCCVFSFEGGGEWNQQVRYLRMRSNTYVSALEDTTPSIPSWWRFATYHWTFDADVTEGHGQVQLGFWTIPLEILTAKLRPQDDNWVWSHHWFRGEPRQEMTLVRMREGARLKSQ